MTAEKSGCVRAKEERECVSLCESVCVCVCVSVCVLEREREKRGTGWCCCGVLPAAAPPRPGRPAAHFPRPAAQTQGAALLEPQGASDRGRPGESAKKHREKEAQQVQGALRRCPYPSPASSPLPRC